MNKIALVVDDEESARDVVTLLFKSMGFDVKTAQEGKEALEILRKNTVAIIFLDLAMPVMTGEELMRAMAQDEKLRTIPIVIDTAQGRGTGRLEKVQEEFSDKLSFKCFTRPGSIAVLKTTVEELLK